MRRYFNTEGSCIPEKHYMVPLDDRVRKIKERYVDRGSYFIINRGRQYGKTTTLRALARYLEQGYMVVSMDFQKIGAAGFRDESTFSKAFAKMFSGAVERSGMADGEALCAVLAPLITDVPAIGLIELFERLSRICAMASRPIVMMIDEVDSATNNQVFLDFLAMLRSYYLEREDLQIFHSVILAGVYDIKNLKLKLRPEAEHKYNSPWNIAAEFKVDMSFSPTQIERMLESYEQEHHTGADMRTVAEEIYQYTSGYPYLVSVICKTMDEDLPEDPRYVDQDPQGIWGKAGVAYAVDLLLKRNLTLFDSMVRQLDQYPDLREMLEDILYCGKRIVFSPGERSTNLGIMFGFLKEQDGRVAIANRIFEMVLLNMFIAQESRSDAFSRGDSDRSQFVKNGRLDMDLVLRKFVEYFQEIYSEKDERFLEVYGRKLFLLYLKPIINGTGNYYLEAQTRDARRTDVVVDYLGEQFIVELKIWRGNEYNERGEAQLAGYLDLYRKEKGYMLSFNFNKKKKTGVKEIRVGDKVIVEAVV